MSMPALNVTGESPIQQSAACDRISVTYNPVFLATSRLEGSSLCGLSDGVANEQRSEGFHSPPVQSLSLPEKLAKSLFAFRDAGAVLRAPNERSKHLSSFGLKTLEGRGRSREILPASRSRYRHASRGADRDTRRFFRNMPHKQSQKRAGLRVLGL